MRRFEIDAHGSAATGAPAHATGVEWDDGLVTVRLRNELEPAHFRSMAGLIEDNGVAPRWLDPPNGCGSYTADEVSEMLTALGKTYQEQITALSIGFASAMAAIRPPWMDELHRERGGRGTL